MNIPDAATLDLTNGDDALGVGLSDQSSGWRTVILKEDHGGPGVRALRDRATPPCPQGMRVVSRLDEPARAAPALLPLNTWTHLAATYDGANLRMYVNGALVRHRRRHRQHGEFDAAAAHRWQCHLG